MNHSTCGLPLCAALITGAAPAVADITLEMSVSPTDGQRQVIQVSEGRVRLASGAAGRDVVLLYREGREQYQVLDGESKTVMTFTPQQVEKTLQQASGVMQQMQSMMAEQMKNMPPEQRAQIEQMMGKSAAPKARVEPQLRMTQRTDQVGQWRCEVAEVVEGNRITSELCLAKTSVLGIPERDHQTLKAFFAVMSRMAGAVGQGMGRKMPMFDPQSMPGVPVRAVQLDGGSRTEVMRLSRVGSERLEDGLFDVPPGFQPAQLPAMPGMPTR